MMKERKSKYLVAIMIQRAIGIREPFFEMRREHHTYRLVKSSFCELRNANLIVYMLTF